MRRAAAALAALCALALGSAALGPPSLADRIDTIEHPTEVPAFAFISLGNGIEPGRTGMYGFTLTNRYNASMENVSLTVEIYRWATVERAANVSTLAAPPTFSQGGTPVAHLTYATIPANGSVDVRLEVGARAASLEGAYFTRHWVEFDYPNVTEPPAPSAYSAHFVMKSRGYFTAEEFASINYSDLHNSLAALNVSGILPDSSFSVKEPAPLWPLALLVAATAVTGTLALLYAVVDQSPGRHRRIERALLRMEGKARVLRALLAAQLARRTKQPAKKG